MTSAWGVDETFVSWQSWLLVISLPFLKFLTGFNLLGYMTNVCEMDLCQYGSFSQSNAHRRSCYCDIHCELLNDCCFDYITECSYGYNSSAVQFYTTYNWPVACGLDSGQLSPLNMTSSMEDRRSNTSYMSLISTCPDGFNNTALIEACHAYQSVVVFGLSLYRNGHCAQCNGRSQPDTVKRCDSRIIAYDYGSMFLVDSASAQPNYRHLKGSENNYPLTCALGTYNEPEKCVQDTPRTLNNYEFNCSSEEYVIRIRWKAEVLWTGQTPLSCLLEAMKHSGLDDSSAALMAISTDWTFLFKNDSSYLVSIEGETSWDVSSFTFDSLSRIITSIFNMSNSTCKIASAFISEFCTNMIEKSPNHCPGILLPINHSDLVVTLLNNETFIHYRGAIWSILFANKIARYSERNNTFSAFERQVVCLKFEFEAFFLNCTTVLVPNSSYSIMYEDWQGRHWV